MGTKDHLASHATDAKLKRFSMKTLRLLPKTCGC